MRGFCRRLLSDLEAATPCCGRSSQWLFSEDAGGRSRECLFLACTSDIEAGLPGRDSSRDGLPFHSYSGVDHMDPANSYGVVRLVRGVDARGSSQGIAVLISIYRCLLLVVMTGLLCAPQT